MIQAKKLSFVKMKAWLRETGPFESHNRGCSSIHMSLSNEQICRKISEDKIAL